MLWYYSAIIDWMVANPGRPLRECAQYIGRTQTTLSIIINSDMFKAALAQRKAEFQNMHDIGLIQKTTRVANAGLDAILDSLEKRRDKIPLADLNTVTEGALSRLGYGTKPAAGVTVNVGTTTNVVLPVSSADLEVARMALRQVQANSAKALPAAETVAPEQVQEAEFVTIEQEAMSSAPTPSND
jgi:hypothetical protein